MSNKAQQQTGQEAYEETSRNEKLTSQPASQDIKKDLKERLGKLSPLSPECCIYRVPKRLRKINAEAYTPQLVSIGPLHHGKESLQAMEEHKLRYLQSFLDRTEKGVEYYVNVVKEWEERARHSYAETIKFERDEFVEMILVDGVFIIELFLKRAHHSLRNETDRIFHKPWMIGDLRRDIILLENQLPFFVLEGLFDLAFGSHGCRGESFIALSHKFFKSLSINKVPTTMTSSSEVKHFADLLRNFCLPSSPREIPVGEGKYGFRRSATELHKAGVEFEKCTSNCLHDLQFTPTTGVLKIPQFRIEDPTESILRNLVAFEQCHHDENRYICDYIYVMDSLINTPQDVELLAGKEIIDNWLGDDVSASTLFNNLGKGINLTGGRTFYYSRLCEQLNAYHKVTWHTWWATLKRDYFGSPWRTASTSAAIFLLLLTLIQTICSIISTS